MLASITAALGVAVLPAVSASAINPGPGPLLPLPLGTFDQFVADPHGHLFFAGGGLAVTDLSGKRLPSPAGEGSAASVALSPDGSTVYVALYWSAEVSAISTTTLKQTAAYMLPASDQPYTVAVQGGKLWVGYNGGLGPGAGIGSFDLTAASPAFDPTALTVPAWAPTVTLAADPSDSGHLLAAANNDPLHGQPLHGLVSFDVSGATPVLLDESATFPNCGFNGFAVTAGGKQVILACNGRTTVHVIDTTTLAQVGQYTTGNAPQAVAVAPDGSVAAGAAGGPNLSVYRAGGTAPENTYEINYQLQGLAWSADGSTLYAVGTTVPHGIPEWWLETIGYPQDAVSSVGLSGPSSAGIDTPVSLAGFVHLGTGRAHAGVPVAVTRTRKGSSAKVAFPLTTAADGSFTLADTPPVLRTYTYTARYAGDTTYAPSSNALTVTVTLRRPPLTITTGTLTSGYGRPVHVTAHLGRANTSRVVSIYEQPVGSHTRKLLRTGPVDAHGTLTVSYAPVHSTTFEAVSAGGGLYAPLTVTRTVAVSARVTLTLSGYYASTRNGGVLYRLYHHDAHLNTTVTVAPDKAGDCIYLDAQEYFNGAWQASVLYGCQFLDSASSFSGYLLLSTVDRGVPYRIRADYPSSDNTNGPANAAWQYFIVNT
jgi:sugar lactone lactonase YvrE